MSIAKLLRAPRFLRGAQIEYQDLSTRAHNARASTNRLRRIRGMVQRLANSSATSIDAFSSGSDRVPPSERDIGLPPPAGQRLGARQQRR